jgi:hypothetical protein
MGADGGLVDVTVKPEGICWEGRRARRSEPDRPRALPGRASRKGGFEAFPYWSRRIPTCVAGLAGGEVLADGHRGDERGGGQG